MRNCKRVRKSTKYFYIIVAIMIIVVSICNITKTLSSGKTTTKTKQIYSYTNKFNYNYDIETIPNKFIEDLNDKSKNFAYVTDLIDTITINLDYLYDGSKESNLNYDYEIIGKMQAFYTKDSIEQKILEKDDVLKEKVSASIQNSSLRIDDEIKLDLKDKNEMLNEFQQKMGMSIDAKYIVMLKINVKTEVEGEFINSIYTPAITVDLGKKTTEILGDIDKEETQYISKKYQEPVNDSTIWINVAFIVLAIGILIYANTVKGINRIKNEHKQELNKILKLCEDKIVQVNSTPEMDSNNTVYVKDVGKIITLSEVLFKPILYYYNQKNEDALFCVMSNNVAYKYVLKK